MDKIYFEFMDILEKINCNIIKLKEENDKLIEENEKLKKDNVSLHLEIEDLKEKYWDLDY